VFNTAAAVAVAAESAEAAAPFAPGSTT
jgi:hypothetical protein